MRLRFRHDPLGPSVATACRVQHVACGRVDFKHRSSSFRRTSFVAQTVRAPAVASGTALASRETAGQPSSPADEEFLPPQKPGESEVDQVQLETLGLLEWPEVCRQVASFTRTTVAAELLLSSGLPLGRSQVGYLSFNIAYW